MEKCEVCGQEVENMEEHKKGHENKEEHKAEEHKDEEGKNVCEFC